ncbi:hypothetical protein SAMN04487949_2871 [Halogranum gelatinilyticum]|uniref:Agglutinin C-terminal domain-containing protein n=1 Tax=Halogranum gelatinilyticum TaxID=660521 RepID=A0A1G9X846_9EURY|nr:hypothetical protein [Halogranum gelatinilyticum]SDM92646.1 hypothetical protein SAMN04487949_2871 [Halogranum gelatinilyticum]
MSKVPDRRTFLKWAGFTPISGAIPYWITPERTIQVMPDEQLEEPPTESESITTTRRSVSWVQKHLRDYFGSDFYKAPNQGIFHHYPDYTYDLFEPDVFRELAASYSPKVIPGNSERYDCDEYATGFRWYFLTGGFGKFPPTNMVGQAHNFAGNHVYNVAICADGTILEWEPQTGTLAADSGAPPRYYEFTNGILYL